MPRSHLIFNTERRTKITPSHPSDRNKVFVIKVERLTNNLYGADITVFGNAT